MLLLLFLTLILCRAADRQEQQWEGLSTLQ